MKNVHVLPTDKPSKIGQSIFDESLHFNPIFNYKLEKERVIPQNIYITSNEEIKEGDWVYSKSRNKICKVTGISKWTHKDDYSIDLDNENYFIHHSYCKKIILTTDPQLIADGVQPIDDTFLEWFIKNPSCDEVEVGYGWIRLTETDNEGYWVSIPNKQFEMQQEEHPKQEPTLEEAAEKYMIEKYRQGTYLGKLFIDGAKWQQERMYSEEEVHRIIESYQDNMENNPIHIKYKDWFEQFKKK